MENPFFNFRFYKQWIHQVHRRKIQGYQLYPSTFSLSCTESFPSVL
ncbi:unnamed protein product [Brassica oleracea]